MELTDKLDEFLRNKYQTDIINATKENKAIIIDFSQLDRFDPLIADQLLEDPDNVLNALNGAATKIAFDEKITVRVKNLPASKNIRIRSLRAKHMGKLWSIDATIKSATEVKPQIYEAIFECPECNAKINVPQEGNVLQKPGICECGRRGDFKLVDKKLYDVRWLVGMEPFEVTTGEQPGEISFFLKEDLTTPRMQKKSDPGARLRIVGVLKELPRHIKGKLSTKLDMYVDANYFEPSEITFEELEITQEDEKLIKELATDPDIFDKLKASIAPGIYGFDEIKESLVLQLFGGVVHTLPDKSRIRGNIHILLTGDPGVGKTMLLKLVSGIVPRGKYVSGSGVTGAGLTASVVKNEALGSWVLEAGALILCNKGLISIDEFDKMNRDDQIAMHEATSVESYHKDMPLTLSDGSIRKIGNLVNELLEKNRGKIIKGRDCYFINITGPELLTTEFSKITRKRATRISKHRAPDYFFKMTLQNGRNITVTPNHPCFVFDDGKFIVKPAERLVSGNMIPIPRIMPIKGRSQRLGIDKNEIMSRHYKSKHIKLPTHTSPKFCRFIGYLISEGSHEINRKKITGISFTNSDRALLEDFRKVVKKLFGLEPYEQKKAGRTMLRYASVELKNFMDKRAPTLLENSDRKTIPDFIFRCSNKEIAGMIRAMFDGDGSVYKQKNALYVTYTTASRVLSEQLHELLLRFGIVSYINRIKPSGRTKKVLYSVAITGSNNLENFIRKIGFSSAKKNRSITEYLKNKTYRTPYAEKIPVGRLMIKLLKRMRLPQKQVFGHTLEYNKFSISRKKLQASVSVLENYMKKISAAKKDIHKKDIASLRKTRNEFNIPSSEIAKHLGVCHQMVSYIELRNVRKYLKTYRKALTKCLNDISEAGKDLHILKNLAFGIIALCKVKSIEKIENTNESWTYDVTVPGETFLSSGMVLHNTVSIAKASIVATLPAQTAVLAGANPKLGRFDPYLPIGEQINIPETLLSRFDLKFALKDKPDRSTDERLAEHIILSRTKPETIEPAINPFLLRKYIAYAKQINNVELTEEASKILKDFYVDMRTKYTGEEIKTVSITLRQYEALIRLAEASAKVRLKTGVEAEDAERAVRLMQYSLMQLGYDFETGRIDIDKIESGVTASKRKKITLLLEILDELQKESKEVAVEDLKAEAETQGIEGVDEILDRLRREGTIFEPRAGFIRKI